ncbi:MAG TPA: prolipoprotein diacylglyceryl transferase family protein [Thermoleophilia bacterium]|nr:prolipoprotein diacylglyceryl transferase family protein [Thermoleophilia bacterium]
MLLSIPSPGDPYLFRWGALQPRWYGVLLALGVLVAGWMARREFRRRGIDPELAYSIAVWTVPFGLVGARLYHVATD